MWIWLALFATPSISLLCLSVAYALVQPACAHQDMTALHGVYALGVALSALLTAMAWRGARPTDLQTPQADGDTGTRWRFLASLAVPTGLLFTLVTFAQWMATWFISPCAY